MSATLLARLIIEDGNKLAYANRCTAAKLPDKRESYYMFLKLAKETAQAQKAVFTPEQIEQCAALLQEHYSQHIVQFQFYKSRTHTS